MMRAYRIVLCVVFLLPQLAIAVLAQQKPPEPDKRVVKVQVVLSRYEGDRKTSSLPFTMLATADGGLAQIRTGSQVPIVSGTAAPNADKLNFQYIDVGTNVDVTVKTTENGRFNVILNFQDRSAMDKVPLAGSVSNPITAPVLRNFLYVNSVLLKDGESKQFVAASDKASGEMIKIDVTLNVEK
jgi:hypothetical protein